MKFDVYIQGELIHNFEFKDAEVILGRSSKVQATVSSTKISRQHLKLEYVDGALLAEDLQSRNGSKLNGTRLEPGIPLEVRPGDKLILGKEVEVHLLAIEGQNENTERSRVIVGFDPRLLDQTDPDIKIEDLKQSMEKEAKEARQIEEQKKNREELEFSDEKLQAENLQIEKGPTTPVQKKESSITVSKLLQAFLIKPTPSGLKTPSEQTKKWKQEKERQASEEKKRRFTSIIWLSVIALLLGGYLYLRPILSPAKEVFRPTAYDDVVERKKCFNYDEELLCSALSLNFGPFEGVSTVIEEKGNTAYFFYDLKDLSRPGKTIQEQFIKTDLYLALLKQLFHADFYSTYLKRNQLVEYGVIGFVVREGRPIVMARIKSNKNLLDGISQEKKLSILNQFQENPSISLFELEILPYLSEAAIFQTL